MLLDKLLKTISPGKNKQARSAPLTEPDIALALHVEATQAPKAESAAVQKLGALTKREHALLLLLLEGCTLKEAASRLTIKYSTANTHMTSLYKKLGVSTRAELLIRYLGVFKEQSLEKRRELS